MDALSALLPSEPLLAPPAEEAAGLAVRHYRHPPSEVPEVRHGDHVLVVHLDGVLPVEQRIEGERHSTVVAPGQISLTPAGQAVSRRWRGETEVLLVLLSEGILAEAARDLDADPARLQLAPRLGAPDVDIDRLGRLLLSEIASPSRGRKLMMETLARQIAIHLIRRHSNVSHLPAISKTGLPPRRLARVVDFMRENLAEPLTVDQLAKVVELSASHLTRAFRQALGTTPYAYLTELRLARARDLLQHSEHSVTEIAFRCGFEQSQHFATAFRRKLGTTPTAWRRAVAENTSTRCSSEGAPERQRPICSGMARASSTSMPR